MDTRRPFTTAQAATAGITRAMLRGRRYRSVFRDVYVDASVPDSLRLRAEAALLLHPEGAAVSHTTAARLLGLPVDSDDVHVTSARARDRRRRPGISTHVAAFRGTRRRGFLVVAGADLFLQLAEMLPLVDLVVAGDAMVRREMVTPEGLVAAAARGRGRGTRLARQAAGLVRAGVDSPWRPGCGCCWCSPGFPSPRSISRSATSWAT